MPCRKRTLANPPSARRPFAAERLEARLPLAAFLVTTTDDDGPGSLRAAIEAANATPNDPVAMPDEIRFQIPGGGVHTIRPESHLPALLEAAIVDGWSQPGFAGSPVIELDGSFRPMVDGLLLAADGSAVRGIAIYGFDNGIRIVASDCTVAGNYLGIDAAGTGAHPNDVGVFIAYGRRNVIGTNGDGANDATEGNLISGNRRYGVLVAGDVVLREETPPNTLDNVIAGNVIGLDASGLAPLSNPVGIGIYGSERTRIGTNGDGLADAAERNVISGNAAGIVLGGRYSVQFAPFQTHPFVNGSRTVVAGNWIGTDATGLGPLGNGVGVYVEGVQNRIGTNGDGVHDAAERNIIAANGEGVVLAPSVLNDNLIALEPNQQNSVAGNWIGLNAAGEPLASGNFAELAIVQAALAEFEAATGAPGVCILQQAFTSIAVYSKREDIFELHPVDVGPYRLSVFPEGSQPPTQFRLNLGGNGVTAAGRGNAVGGFGPLANVIAHNAGAGIAVRPVRVGLMGVLEFGPGIDPARNVLRGNSIYANAGLGIDLGEDFGLRQGVSEVIVEEQVTVTEYREEIYIDENGVEHVRLVPYQVTFTRQRVIVEPIHPLPLLSDGPTLNDTRDADSGPNGLRNYPVLSSVVRGAQTRVVGALASTPRSTFTIDVYADTSRHSSGFGQGERYLASFQVTTDAHGNVDFDRVLPAATAAGELITATATDPAGNTSEFSFAPRGSVAARVERGRLIVEGNEAAAVQVFPGTSPNSLRVSDGGGTRTFSGITRGLEVDLGDHADALFLTGIGKLPLRINGAVNVDTGEGDDALWLAPLEFRAAASLATGFGRDHVKALAPVARNGFALDAGLNDDLIRILAANVFGPTRIDAGQGMNDLALRGGALRGAVQLLAGDADDFFELGGVSILGRGTIDLGAGNDRLEMRGLKWTSGLAAALHDGSDIVQVFQTTFSGVTDIQLGGGHNLLAIRGSTFRGPAAFRSGDENDHFDLGSEPIFEDSGSPLDNRFASSLLVEAGDGDNTVWLQHFTLQSSLTIRTGAGRDSISVGGSEERRASIIGRTTIATGDGQDTVGIFFARLFGDARVELGDGNDSFFWSSSVLAGLTVLAGEGDDLIVSEDSTAHRRVELRGEAGFDSVYIERSYDGSDGMSPSYFNSLVTINLGGDDDFLGIGSEDMPDQSARFASLLVVEGGGGSNALILPHGQNRFFVRPIVRNFDAPVPP